MPHGVLTVAYIASAILFIFSLGGLSNQETARKGNVYGILGMLIDPRDQVGPEPRLLLVPGGIGLQCRSGTGEIRIDGRVFLQHQSLENCLWVPLRASRSSPWVSFQSLNDS